MTVPGAAPVLTAHHTQKHKFNFFFVTLQVEDICLDESGAEAIDVTHNHARKGT
jgi:cobalt-zinc-cadmium efflux system protein